MEQLNNITTKEQQKLYLETNKLYIKYTKELVKEMEIVEAKSTVENGIITNESVLRKHLDKILILIATLWRFNRKNIIGTSKEILSSTYELFNIIGDKKGILYLTDDRIKGLIKTQLSDRQKIVNFNAIIKGNVKKLNKKVNKIVLNGLKDGRTQKQIAKKLELQMKFDKNRAKSIAATETNYYKTEGLLTASQESGELVKKTWVYTYLSKEARESHLQADGQVVYGTDGYFHIGSNVTKAPQHFGIPSEDINCNCTMTVEIVGELDL